MTGGGGQPAGTHAAARALKEIPIVNCTYDEAAEEMVLHDRYNVGVAVATPQGLVGGWWAARPVRY